MSQKPLRPCRYPGCTELVPDGYCDTHRPARAVDQRSSDAAAWHRLYKTETWRVLRNMQLAKEPWCCACARLGLRTPATDVDHIVDHRGDWSLFSDPGNLQSLCHSHHSQKTATTIRSRRNSKRR